MRLFKEPPAPEQPEDMDAHYYCDEEQHCGCRIEFDPDYEYERWVDRYLDYDDEVA